jgi:UDP-N-acetylmuramoyl-tripeptide--D-alanyl-D-alanine ligase
LERMSICEILEAVDGELYLDGKCYEYNDISTDTRKIGKGSVFIALKGENFNGNEFVSEAVKKGAIICLVDEIRFDKQDLDSRVTIIKVEDTKKALRELAKYYRSKLDIKIVGITGSTGKTSTKDLVAAALSGKFRVFKTKGNYNNEIGLPLMIFKLNSAYDVAVLEMGMSNLQEIHRLADIARPDIGIITNVGISHIENLGTRENILKAKMEIADFFNKENLLIINADNDLLSTVSSKEYNLRKIGVEVASDYRGENIILMEDSIAFQVKEFGELNSHPFELPIPGKHNVLNTLMAIACGRELGMEMEDISEGLRNLEVTSMRLDIVRNTDYTIIDDCYNASPDSMKAAIDVEKQVKGSRRIAVLGTMRELGDKAYDAHKDVGEYARLKGIDLLITVGEYNNAYKEGFGWDERYVCFQSTIEAAEYVQNIAMKDDIILVKASRAMKFETIVDRLKK